MEITHTSIATPEEPGSAVHTAQRRAAEYQQRGREAESIVIHLFDQLQARVLRYVIACGLPLHDAEDIVQETFVSLFRHVELGRPRSNLNGWIFRVAHNLALKRRSANQRVERIHADENTLVNQAIKVDNAEEQFSFQQTQLRLRNVFDALAEQDQRCLRLRADGLKYREIAEVLGISLGGVSMSISRSLARMIRATGCE